jgi:hypothetical protein
MSGIDNLAYFWRRDNKEEEERVYDIGTLLATFKQLMYKA